MGDVGRNDPCPCGSGLKYKKCCLQEETDNPEDFDRVAQARTFGFKEMSQENWLEAINSFKSILDESQDPHVLLEAVGACYDGLEDYLMAAEYFEKALAIAPESRRAALLYRLGVARACGNRPEKAAESFRQCLETADDPSQKKHLNEILQELDEIQAGNRTRNIFLLHAHLQRAFTEMDAEKYEAAAARLERIQTLEPDNPVVSYNLGVAYAFLKREEEALAHFQQTVDINPEYVQAWYNMGQICMIKMKDFSKALHCFDRAIAIRPDYVGAHHQRGVVLELLGDPEKALECWKKTLELDPENKQAMENIKRLGASTKTQPAQ
ncbi:MAG: tetratricopeptide repeat protein [Desulfomonile tiedjei]|uniref:Tetratricopeptide repeat protein n=1 Tax=Desulfomonile tiedjei TaxID=2358 RepID=A0A9D6UYS1_9BACT|nr:tetratricopeptide repeat protein [Desulfomonile tiedjei]